MACCRLPPLAPRHQTWLPPVLPWCYIPQASWGLVRKGGAELLVQGSIRWVGGNHMEDRGARVTCPLEHPGASATSSKESRSRLVGCLTSGVGGQSLPLPTPLWRTCEVDPPVLGLHMHLLICILTFWFTCSPPGLMIRSFEPQPPSSQHHPGGSQPTQSPHLLETTQGLVCGLC